MHKTAAVQQRASAAAQLVNYGNQLRGEKKFALALASFRRAAALCPLDPTIWNNIGAILWMTGYYQESVEVQAKALALAPNHKMANANMGSAMISLRRYDEAEAYFEKDIRLNPDETTGLMMRAFGYLDKGDWKRGLDEYEVRLRHRALHYQKMPVAYWNGEDLSGKTIFIQAEQGIGDTILFSRFLPLLANRYPTAKIKVCVSPIMVNLLWEFRDIVEFLPESIPWPDDLDFGVYMGSLCRHFDLRPDNIPADPQRIRARVQNQNKLYPFLMDEPNGRMMKVGVAWTGNPIQDRNHDRSIPPEMLFSLIENPNVVLYSLQVGPGEADYERIGAEGVSCNLAPKLAATGLVGCGNAMLGLDLVITVCTSIAHMAGALGVPCWTLLSYDPYWIWGREGERTPWYPSTRLFRQEAPRDWDGVIQNVRTELDQTVESWLKKGK